MKPSGAHDLDHAPAREQAGGHLRHARVLGAGDGVDLFEQSDLLLERDEVERAGIGIEMAIGPLGRRGERPLGRIEQLQRLARAADGSGADFVGMGKTGRLARHSAQAEARIARIVCGLQPSVVETEGFGRDELEVKLAIVAGRQQTARQCASFVGSELVAVDEGVRIESGRGHRAQCRHAATD